MIVDWFGEYKGLNYYALSNNLICFSLIPGFQVESSSDILCCYFGTCHFAIALFLIKKAFTEHFLYSPGACLCTADAYSLLS